MKSIMTSLFMVTGLVESSARFIECALFALVLVGCASVYVQPIKETVVRTEAGIVIPPSNKTGLDEALEEPSVGLSQRRLPFEMRCDQCMWSLREVCSGNANFLVAATVTDVQAQRSDLSCIKLSTDPSDPPSCDLIEVVSFGSIEILQGSQYVSESDRFLTKLAFTGSGYRVPENTRPGEHVAGVRLKANTRYLIFAGDHRDEARFEADWKIDLACELSDSVNAGEQK